jgi:transposase-like protein
MNRRGGTPWALRKPEHVLRRALALAILDMGEPVKKAAALAEVSPSTLWRWRAGKLKTPA